MAPTLITVTQELHFDGREGRLDEVRLSVQNVTKQRLGYKLFPDRDGLYSFQPSCGFIDKSSSVRVVVKLLKVPKDSVVVSATVSIKARLARDDEMDREKEWRTAMVQDENSFHVVPVKTRIGFNVNDATKITSETDEDESESEEDDAE